MRTRPSTIATAPRSSSADAPKRLNAEEAKVSECREMASRAKFPEHRLMLEHMTGTWERIARTLEAEH